MEFVVSNSHRKNKMSVAERSASQLDELVNNSRINEELVRIVEHLVEKHWDGIDSSVFKVKLVKDCFYYRFPHCSPKKFDEFLGKTIVYYENRKWIISKNGFFSQRLTFKRA